MFPLPLTSYPLWFLHYTLFITTLGGCLSLKMLIHTPLCHVCLLCLTRFCASYKVVISGKRTSYPIPFFILTSLITVRTAQDFRLNPELSYSLSFGNVENLTLHRINACTKSFRRKSCSHSLVTRFHSPSLYSIHYSWGRSLRHRLYLFSQPTSLTVTTFSVSELTTSLHPLVTGTLQLPDQM